MIKWEILRGCIESREIDCPISSPIRVVAEGATVVVTGSGRARLSDASPKISRGQLCLHLKYGKGDLWVCHGKMTSHTYPQHVSDSKHDRPYCIDAFLHLHD